MDFAWQYFHLFQVGVSFRYIPLQLRGCAAVVSNPQRTHFSFYDVSSVNFDALGSKSFKYMIILSISPHKRLLGRFPGPDT